MPSNWISDIEWDDRGPYRTFLMDGPGYKAGQKTYVSPAEVSPSNTTDPRLLQWAEQNQPKRGGFINSGGTWNRDSGKFEGGTNWGNIAALGIGGAIAAPFVAPALGSVFSGLGGGGAASATSSMIPGTGIPTVAGTGGGGMGGGILSAIGKGLGYASKGSDVLNAIGGVTSGAAQGSANQRLAENQGLLSQQQMALLGARDQFSAGLSGAQFKQSEQDRQRKAAILAALLKGTQDQTVTPGNPLIAARMPQVSGGPRPSNLTGNADALLQLLAGGPIEAPQYQAPQMPPIKHAGVGENILGGIGLGSSLLGAIGSIKKRAA